MRQSAFARLPLAQVVLGERRSSLIETPAVCATEL
jgi:hypothetical protein